MSLAERDRASEPEPEPQRQSRQSSKLLPLLFGGLDRNCRLTVLDLGRALPETVDFFSGFHCKIHVVDVYSELQSGRLDRNASGKTLQRQFRNCLGSRPARCWTSVYCGTCLTTLMKNNCVLSAVRCGRGCTRSRRRMASACIVQRLCCSTGSMALSMITPFPSGSAPRRN